MVPASVELKVYEGVVSLSGVVTAVTSASIGAVVSVVELSVVVTSSVVVISSISSSSLLEEQEIMIVKPIHETNKT